MKKLICTILLGVATYHPVVAADSTPAPAKAPENAPASPDAAAAVTPARIELKNKSSFALEANSRNPFWPIGWKPAPKITTATTAPEPAGPEISPSAFVVSSIITGEGSRFAIINGKPMQEGQIFGLQIGTEIYQITVKAIEDGQVILQRRGSDFAVPLRRK